MNKFCYISLFVFLNIFFGMEEENNKKLVNKIIKYNKIYKKYFLNGPKNISNQDEFNVKKLKEIYENNKYIANIGMSFGNDNSIIDIILASKIKNNVTENKPNSILLLSAGKGGLNEYAVCTNVNKENITYNDSFIVLMPDFLKRMNIGSLKSKNGNMFNIDENDKYDYVLASNSFHFYNKRNKEYFCGYLASNFIIYKMPFLLKKNSIFTITSNSTFIINMLIHKNKGSNNIKNNLDSLYKYIDKKNLLEDIILNIDKIINNKKITWTEARDKYLDGYNKSEEINNKNEFTLSSLWPSDLFEMNEDNAELIKKYFSKITINYINNSSLSIKTTVILDDENDFNLLNLKLRENPLIKILKKFNSKIELQEFINSKSLDDDIQKKFGIKIDFKLNNKLFFSKQEKEDKELLIKIKNDLNYLCIDDSQLINNLVKN